MAANKWRGRQMFACILRNYGSWPVILYKRKAAYSLGMTAGDLADLIDPTCHVVSEALHTGSFGCEEAGTEFTLSCGHTVIVDGDFPPGYCDECGARVVSER